MQLSSNISIKTQELFARTVDVENRAVKSDDFSGAWFSPVDGDIDEKCNADVSFKEDILLHHCLRHITRVLQKCCCNCVEMGQSCCQYETSGLQGCFLDVVAALSHVDLFQRPSYKADEQLWVFYFALIKRMAWKDWPPLDIYLALISTAARDSKRIVMCLKDLWDDDNRGSLNSFDQYVLTKYFRWREDYEETATSSAERPLLTVESSLSCDSYVVQLSLLLQIDKMVGRNLSPDIVKAVFGAVLGIPGGGEIRSDLELFNTYPLLSVLIDSTRCRYARDIVCSSREVRLVLWAAYLDYIVSGSCRATAMWQLSHMYSFVPEQEWNSAVIAVKSLTADDTEFRSELMTIIRLALAATDINLDQDSGNNALSFSVTANLTETLQNYDTSIHCGFESFIGFRETVWWHVMLLLESFDRDSSGMWSCIHELSSSNQYAFHMQSTFYPALYPKPHHQIGQDSLLHVLKIACALKSALKLELPPASFSCMIVGMMKDMNGSLLNMTMNSFWNINELLSMPYHPVEVLFFWLYTGIDKCLFRANNLPLFKESLLGINKIDRCNVAWLLQWVSIVALMISENPVEDPSLVIDLIDLVFLVFLRGDSQNELVDLLAIENSRVIEFMNIITVQYDRFGTALACVCRLIRQAQVILPRLDVLYSHFLKLVEVEHTKETANKSTCYYRPDYLGAFQLFTQQVSPRYRLVHSATAEVMEEVILGECNYSGHYNSCLYYYGREWCGYQNLRQFKSFLLLRVAISCFMTEKYLCTFVIQQELIYRRLRSPFDAACCFHLMAFTDYPGAINLASNDFDLISYPISEQFISIDDIREDVLRDVVNVVSEPFVRSNLAADYFTSDQLKCNFEGKFSVDIPLALGFASQMLELNLSSCGLSAFPVHLFHLSNVMRLNVSHNNLMALPVDRFAKAYPKLVMCNLSFNNFTSLPSELSKIDNLQELYINDNAIEYIPDRLLDMNALRVFDLSNNKLKALPPGMIALRRQIQFLKLSGNPMIASSIPPRTSDLLGSTSRASATVQSGVKLAPAVSKISHTTMSTPVLSTGVKLDNSVSIPLKKSKPLDVITENNEPGAEERVHDSHKISTNTTKKETIVSAKIGRSGHSRDMPFVLVSSDSESGVSDNGLIVEEDGDDSTTCSVEPFGACVHFSEESDTA